MPRPTPQPGVELFRCMLAFLLFFMVVYIAVAPKQMIKVNPEIAAVSFGALTTLVPLYVVFLQCCPLPYAIKPLIATDVLCGACWAASTVLLPYWDRNVRYMSWPGDPEWSFECTSAAEREDFVLLTAGEDYVQYINIM
ncbi:uncharacterized protein E0L32_007637 [Thyridium curvatum]|uniref:Uncharacterized protein n=1 Tax=Thyridium curvatum TaxID=1093900 RepID=A0A507B459_9PEZI|nr:uncharacterized protein E0L32_007637 [Thyridium curvatum]TPX11658.1 hypothetical protein E0L32_007637 [Thyridium curvatum]